MRIEIRIFGAEARAAGADALAVDLDGPATCGSLREAMRERSPALAPALGWARFAVNGRYADDETEIGETDEVALIGLVGGG
ncbi:MAG: MoaD/ThiS family protein [Phycisphaeraceae bacterium]|nr:MAG: MoaD/ThiS family protein [Phycisphaeraceae bacterium]